MQNGARALARCWASRPPFDPPKGERLEQATARLFENFVQAGGGNADALAKLEEQAAEFEAMVGAAKVLASTATELSPGLFLVDSVDTPKFDFGEFGRIMAQRGAVVTVTRKGDGPIAAKHGGVQYSAAVTEAHKAKVNLTALKPADLECTPEAGMLANTTFLFHCNEQWWNEVKDGMAALVAAARS